MPLQDLVEEYSMLNRYVATQKPLKHPLETVAVPHMTHAVRQFVQQRQL
jgi:hypothetical protein